MSDRIGRQFDEADAPIMQAVTRFASEIEFDVGLCNWSKKIVATS